MALDRGKLLKIMNMTTSDVDNVALSAVRAANLTLSRACVTWEDIIRPGRSPQAQAYQAPPQRPARPKATYSDPSRPKFEFNHAGSKTRVMASDQIDRMFDTIIRRSRGSFRDAIDDIYHFYELNGYLSEAQYELIRKTYETCEKR